MNNDHLHFLHERVSAPILKEPAPTEEQLDAIFKAALRAPDHGKLKPWRYLIIEGDHRKKLGDALALALQNLKPDSTPEALEQMKAAPLRAPVLIALILSGKKKDNIPEIEQLLSLGAAAYAILLAAKAQGLGAMWRTGLASYQPIVSECLGLTTEEKLCGFIYLGTPASTDKKITSLNTDEFVSYWTS